MKRHVTLGLIFVLALSLLPLLAQAAPDMPAITATNTGKGTQYSLTLQLLALMTTLSVLPSVLLMMTAFVRIVIVMSLLRQALGTGQTPPNMVIVGLSLFLTLFVMTPVLTDVYQNALLPYMNQGLSFDKALAAAEKPIRAFMLLQTREDDIAMFMDIARNTNFTSPQDVPFTTLVPAFVVIDLIVASVLMSMGMMMLSPMMISMPFKLMLFVLVDGWSLIMGSLAGSFAMP
jgi:flagellar biosynthetic protein FliP